MRPNIVVDDNTGKIVAFGFCNFEVKDGETQYECPVEALPDEKDVCIYDPVSNTVSVSNDLQNEKIKARKKLETEEMAGQKADEVLPLPSDRRKLKQVSRAVKLVRKEFKGNASQGEKDELDYLEALDDQVDAIYDAADLIKDEIDLDVDYDHINSPLWP